MNTEQEIITMLDALADLRSKRDLLHLEKEAAIVAATPPLPPKVQEAIAEIEDDYAEEVAAVTDAARELEAAVKEATTEHGHSVKGKLLHAVASTRFSWNNKRLQGYAAAHPEVWAFCRKTRSVAIRQRR